MRHPTPTEWIQLLSEFKTSGLSHKEFVAKHDISFSTFQYWLYTRSKKASGSSPRFSAKFLPVNVVASPAPKARGTDTGVVEARLQSGIVFRFAVGTDTRYLAELLAALG
jgi:hypothetical protein